MRILPMMRMDLMRKCRYHLTRIHYFIIYREIENTDLQSALPTNG